MTARRLSLLAAVVAGTAALSVLLLSLLPGVLNRDSGGVALIGGPFELVDHAGAAVTDQTWADKPLLVFFGYTYCPDVCPTELSVISNAMDLLGDDTDVVPLFITVDPARDTVQAMADYVGHFHPRMVGLTGTPEQIAAAAKAYRVYYAKGSGEGDDYLMDHSSFVYLMDRDHRYLAHFPPNTDPEAMAKRIRELL
jgi:protein SCO1/2